MLMFCMLEFTFKYQKSNRSDCLRYLAYFFFTIVSVSKNNKETIRVDLRIIYSK